MSTGRGNGVLGSFQSVGFKSGEVEVSSRAVWDVAMRCLRSLPLRSLKSGNVSFRGPARIGHPELVLCIKSPWNFHGELSIFYCMEEGSLDPYRATRWKQPSSFICYVCCRNTRRKGKGADNRTVMMSLNRNH